MIWYNYPVLPQIRHGGISMKKGLKVAIALALALSLLFPIGNLKKAEASTTLSATVHVSGKLSVRTGAGTKYKILGYLKNGTKVSVYSKTKSGWSEIRYNKKKAYVSTKYLVFPTVTKTYSVNSFKGTWAESKNDTKGNVYLKINPKSSTKATVDVMCATAGAIHIGDAEGTVTFKNNTANFSYSEDGWGGKGKVTITLHDKYITVKIQPTKSGMMFSGTHNLKIKM